jgi:NAD(P)-dependent dehydrogenase (short-subunit alcohol dehydrogenase family)
VVKPLVPQFTGSELEGAVAVVTGAGVGLGRAEALALGAAGAKVVVNDIGDAADTVAEEIRSAGGVAVGAPGDIGDWGFATGLVRRAVDEYGDLNVLVNNAGVLRDRMIFSISAEEWDTVLRVHLRGHAATCQAATAYWRERNKATGEEQWARIVNTASEAFLFGSAGQPNYSAAKGGIAALTLVQAAELGRYGVTANALAPAARTRMTEGVFTDMMAAVEDGAFDVMDPANVSPLVAWLVSADSAGVTGRMFEIEGGKVGIADGWQHGPTVDKGARWDADELGRAVRELIEAAPAPEAVYGAG